MAYLNFRDPFRKPGDETPLPDPVSVELVESSHQKWKTTFKIPANTREKMAAAFEGLLLSESHASEVRMDFPSGWTLFWKVRDGLESRLLLAHPEKEEWVATFALARDHLIQVRTQFQSTQAFHLSKLGQTSKMSNIEFEVAFV